MGLRFALETLPEGFNSFEWGLDFLRKKFNRMGVEPYRDLGDGNWEPDVSTGRAAARTACQRFRQWNPNAFESFGFCCARND